MSDERAFLGRGWSFPPSFANGRVRMTEDEADIQASLRILFGTAPGERFLQPKFGLDMRELMFEPLSTTLRTVLKDRILTTVLVYEPRIRVQAVDIDDSRLQEGVLTIRLDYLVRSTNSRFNLVFPYYQGEATEAARAASRG
jgi:hypothetical protein